MFLASQLADFSRRFPAHVQDMREFLLREKLPVPSPEAIPELSSRLKTDSRFRADVSSLMRVALYREREQVGYEELLGILVAAAAGNKQDLTSESQEASVREMLRFLLQSRRSMYRPDAEEPAVAVEAEPGGAVGGRVEPMVAEPVQVAPLVSAAESMKREPERAEPLLAVREAENRESDDLVLPRFRTAGLFAAQAELEAPWWRVHAVWIVGMVCLLLGVGGGLMMRRGLPAAGTHAAVSPADGSSSQAKMAGSAGFIGSAAAKESASGKSKVWVSRKRSAVPRWLDRVADAGGVGTGNAGAPAETAQAAPATDEARMAAQPAAPSERASAGRPVAPEESAANRAPDNAAFAHAGGASAVPVTVVKQVVRASADDEVESEPTPTTAATHSIVQPGSAGIMAANVVYSPAPEYPAAASAARVQGEVTVRAVVDPDGNVIYARVVSGPTLLRDAALEAVQKWRYRPLLYYGKPIAVTTTAILDFKFAR